MNKIVNLISTLAAVMVLGYCWGTFGDANNIDPAAIAIGSFGIGMFGSSAIYKWLSKSDTL
jgi:hypothetical protein